MGAEKYALFRSNVKIFPTLSVRYMYPSLCNVPWMWNSGANPFKLLSTLSKKHGRILLSLSDRQTDRTDLSSTVTLTVCTYLLSPWIAICIRMSIKINFLPKPNSSTAFIQKSRKVFSFDSKVIKWNLIKKFWTGPSLCSNDTIFNCSYIMYLLNPEFRYTANAVLEISICTTVNLLLLRCNCALN